MDNQNLVKNTLDQIPQAKSNAKRIVGLVKEGEESLDISYPTIRSWKNSRQSPWQGTVKLPMLVSLIGEIPNI